MVHTYNGSKLVKEAGQMASLSYLAGTLLKKKIERERGIGESEYEVGRWWREISYL